MQYTATVLAAVRVVCERHFGKWRSIDGISGVAITQRIMGFDSGIELYVRFDAASDIGQIAEPNILVSESDRTLLEAEDRWPSARGMNLATFIEFLTSRLPSAAQDQDTREAPLAALDRFPSARFGAVHRPVVDCCISALTVGQYSRKSEDADISRPMLIVGGPGSGKSEILKNVARRAKSTLGFHPVQIDALSRREGVEESFLISAALGSQMQVAESSLLELAPFMRDRILVLVDNVHQDIVTYMQSALFASQRGLRVIATARPGGLKVSDDDLDKVWDTILIEPLWPNEVARFIVDTVSPTSLRSYYPTLSLVKSIVNIEVAGDLQRALQTQRRSQSDQPLDESILALDLFAAWLDRAASEQQAGSSDARISLAAITGLHAIETLIRWTPGLLKRESEYLAVANVLRLTDSPRAASLGGMRDLVSCPFLVASEESVIWTSEIMRRAALAHFLVNQLTGEGTIEPEWPPEINLPYRALVNLAGPKFSYPLMGAVPLHSETLTKMAQLIQRLAGGGQRRVVANLHQIVELSRGSPFYSVWPWRFAAGNSLALLARLGGNSLTGDFSRCRLAAVNLAGIDLSRANFSGSLLSKASLQNSGIAIASLTGAFMGGATVDRALLHAVRADHSIPVFGLRAAEADPWHMLRRSDSQLCIPNAARVVEPFAITPPVTNHQFGRFVKSDDRYGREAYLNSAKNLAREADDYYLKHWIDPDYSEARQGDAVTYVGRDAAIAYLDWAGARLPTQNEWLLAADALTVTEGISEWLWGIDEIAESEPINRNKTTIDWSDMHYRPRRAPQFTATMSEGWLGLVGIPSSNGRKLGRIKSINANEDVTFRSLFDFVHLVGGQL
jgi:hypothetical protein